MLWLILGILIGCVVFYLVSKAKAGEISIKWYQWVLGFMGTGLILFALQNYIALGSREFFSEAAPYVWTIFGLPGLILIALIWVIPLVAKMVTSKKSVKSA